MRLTQERLDIDPHDVQRKTTRFIQDYINKAKSKGIVLGVSGGVDSATTAALATKALGPNKVLGVYMPEEETYTKTDQQHIEHLA
jgi:NAD+ synthase